MIVILSQLPLFVEVYPKLEEEYLSYFLVKASPTQL